MIVEKRWKGKGVGSARVGVRCVRAVEEGYVWVRVGKGFINCGNEAETEARSGKGLQYPRVLRTMECAL